MRMLEKEILTQQVRVGILVMDLGCYSGPRATVLLCLRCAPSFHLGSLNPVQTKYRGNATDADQGP
jgi:hypothetical protein